MQQLKEILIAKEMEIRLLKKEIHHLKRTQRRSPEKPVFKTVYEQNITSGEKLNSPHHRHNRVYSIGDYRDFSSKLSPVEHYNHGGYKRA
ncbi:MAG: hypothetical protein JST59_02775 [Actinobacteria bacterium]|nr:hypothetical protein [Actinomycetota bacterium]